MELDDLSNTVVCFYLGTSNITLADAYLLSKGATRHLIVIIVIVEAGTNHIYKRLLTIGDMTRSVS